MLIHTEVNAPNCKASSSRSRGQAQNHIFCLMFILRFATHKRVIYIQLLYIDFKIFDGGDCNFIFKKLQQKIIAIA